MKDLTKIKTPLGLLGKKTQKALKAHGGPYEVFSGEMWNETNIPMWHGDYAYRVKPSEVAAAEPDLKALVKEWQEAREVGYSFDAIDRFNAACLALAAVVIE